MGFACVAEQRARIFLIESKIESCWPSVACASTASGADMCPACCVLQSLNLTVSAYGRTRLIGRASQNSNVETVLPARAGRRLDRHRGRVLWTWQALRGWAVSAITVRKLFLRRCGGLGIFDAPDLPDARAAAGTLLVRIAGTVLGLPFLAVWLVVGALAINAMLDRRRTLGATMAGRALLDPYRTPSFGSQFRRLKNGIAWFVRAACPVKQHSSR